MGFSIEFNTILVIPNGTLDLATLRLGQTYRVTKSDPRLYALDIPIDLCTYDRQFVARVIVSQLIITGEATQIEFVVTKLYSREESAVISANFAEHA